MKLSIFLAVFFCAWPAFAQQTQGAATQEANQEFFNPFTLASGILERNFVNVFAFANGAYDTNAQVFSNSQHVGGWGYGVGGGIEASHVWKTAQLGISYNGAYQNYSTPTFVGGTTQNLVFGYTKRFARRWTLALTEGAGSFLYGQIYYSFEPVNTTPVVTNPFSPETRYSSTSFSLSYQQTRRLSYVLSGFYSLYRYTGPGGIGASDPGGSFSVQYQLKPRTTLGATYSYTNFIFQRHAGYDHLNGFFGTLSHQFHGRWSGSLSGGVVRSSASGTIAVPVTILTGQQQAIAGYAIGSYHNLQWVPSFNAALSHTHRHSQISVNAGYGVSSGNGIYLATKDAYLGGYYSYTTRASVFSAAGYYSHLSSIANAIGSNFTSTTFTLAYGHNLIRYVAGNLRYDFITYSSLSPYPAQHDNHFSFGLSFSTKNIPLTLF